MAASLIYKQHYSLPYFLSPSKSSQQCGIHGHRIRSSHRIEMDRCRSTVFCGPKIVLLIDRDSERSICFCGHRFQRMKLSPFGKFHFRVDVVDCIWLNDVLNIFDYSDILNKIRRYRYRFPCKVPGTEMKKKKM